MTLGEIAEQAGIPARTIRFYIARGLLQGPVKAGRDAAYASDHLERLHAIKKLQADGHTLSEIDRLLSGPPRARQLEAPVACWQYAVSDQVTILVKAGQSPWLTRQIQIMVADFARGLRNLEKESRKGREPE